MVIRKDDLVRELAKRTPFPQRDTRILLNALDLIVKDYLSRASMDDAVEVNLLSGLTICSRRTPAREVKDPRNQQTIITPEKNIPCAKFTQRFKEKINK